MNVLNFKENIKRKDGETLDDYIHRLSCLHCECANIAINLNKTPVKEYQDVVYWGKDNYKQRKYMDLAEDYYNYMIEYNDE